VRAQRGNVYIFRINGEYDVFPEPCDRNWLRSFAFAVNIVFTQVNMRPQGKYLFKARQIKMRELSNASWLYSPGKLKQVFRIPPKVTTLQETSGNAASHCMDADNPAAGLLVLRKLACDFT